LSTRRFIAIIGILLFPFSAAVSQDRPPPLNSDTIVGVWEAVSEDACLLYRMEINKNGESYLALVGAPKAYYRAVFRLVSSDIKEGKIKLHFHDISGKNAMTDLWIEGKGVWYGGEDGEIRGTIAGNDENEEKQPIRFMKGTWTRMLAELSKKAEETIKTKSIYL